MQFPLIPSNRSKSTRPVTRASILVVLALSAGFGTPTVQAQSRRARTSAKAKSPASSKAAKIRTLEARLRKATATYNSLGQVVHGQAIFLVQGKIRGGDTRRLEIYGKTYGQNSAAASALGQNNDDNFLIIHNAEPQKIMQGTYQGECIALSQTEFTPVPAQYRQAEIAFYKLQDVVVSLQNEIEFEKQAGARAARAREKVRLAHAKQDKARQEKAQASERESVYRTRVALSDRETATKLAQLDGFVTTTSDKDSAYLQSSAAAMALFNKWGSLGVANRTLLWRAFDDLASAAASQVERGNWEGAMQTAEKLLTLELFERAPRNSQSGKRVSSLAWMPGTCACRAPRWLGRCTARGRSLRLRPGSHRRGFRSCQPTSRARRRARRSCAWQN